MRFTKSTRVTIYDQANFLSNLSFIAQALTRMQVPAEAKWDYNYNDEIKTFELSAEWEGA